MPKNENKLRIQTILEAGRKCPALAEHFAYDTDMNPAEAGALIKIHLAGKPQGDYRAGWSRAVAQAGGASEPGPALGWSRAVSHANRA